ncbi:hypothetical protein AQJ64_40565 [Streptomyces griseoruber]|uniref:Uncharacterized protein n=1 Tax=Streptomyces griseoruber TaxID=1943 RepID=A0A101SL97_9ACTN|nr:hypothetical protein AQJ64_40565 [Streptomyces griseoruber]
MVAGRRRWARSSRASTYTVDAVSRRVSPARAPHSARVRLIDVRTSATGGMRELLLLAGQADVADGRIDVRLRGPRPDAVPCP